MIKLLALALLACVATTATAQDPYRARDRGYTAFWSPYSMVVIPSFIPMEVPSQRLTYFQVDPLSGALRSDSGSNRNRGYDSRNRINSDCYSDYDITRQHRTTRASNSYAVQPGGWIDNPFFNGP